MHDFSLYFIKGRKFDFVLQLVFVLPYFMIDISNLVSYIQNEINSYNWYQNLCLDIQNLLCCFTIGNLLCLITIGISKILFKRKYSKF